MKTCSIAKLKTHLSTYLSEVAKGSELVVTDHNKPVAKLISLQKKPLLPNFDYKTLFKTEPISLHKGSKTAIELLREIRNENH